MKGPSNAVAYTEDDDWVVSAFIIVCLMLGAMLALWVST